MIYQPFGPPRATEKFLGRMKTRRGVSSVDNQSFCRTRAKSKNCKVLLTAITVGAGGGGRGALDRRDVLDIMHGRSRIAIDPRIPTMPGRSMPGGGGRPLLPLPF